MIIPSLENYLETLSGYVYDDDKLVTYKWLSKELEIHVNVAKQILWEFWQRNKKDGNIECTIILMGALHDGGIRVELARESNISVAKQKFSKIVSEHLYSLQKTLPDLELLSCSGEGDVKYSAIRCDECIQRSSKELGTLKGNTVSNDSVQTNQSEAGTANPVQEVIKTTASSTDKQSTTGQKHSSTSKTGFNNLFGKAIEKQKSHNDVTEEKLNIKKSPTKKKSPPSRNKVTKSVQKNSLDNFAKKTSDLLNTDENAPISSSVIKTVERTTSVESGTTNKGNARGKKRNRDIEPVNETKRRKRIIDVADSSGSESSNESDDSEVPNSPEAARPVKQTSAPAPPDKPGNKTRRVLKVADETFEEDGYLITKKVHVYESGSEDEENAIEKPKAQPEPKTKKNKQTTLMNFFKK